MKSKTETSFLHLSCLPGAHLLLIHHHHRCQWQSHHPHISQGEQVDVQRPGRTLVSRGILVLQNITRRDAGPQHHCPWSYFLLFLGFFDTRLISLSPIKFSPQNQHMGSHYQHRKGSLCAWQHQHDGHHHCMCYIIVTLFTQGSMCVWQQTALARENLHLLTSKSFVS